MSTSTRPDKLLQELADVAAACYDRISDKRRARLRIAVTQWEADAIRNYMFSKKEAYVGRILNIPLRVEGSPKEPILIMEYPPPDPQQRYRASSTGHEGDYAHLVETSAEQQRLLDHSGTLDTQSSPREPDTPDREQDRSHSTDGDVSSSEDESIPHR